jgi:hypothetical protein
MATNPYWYEAYQENPDEFFDMIQALKEISAKFEDDEKTDLSKVEKL